METMRPTTLAMHTLMLCSDVQFVGATRATLSQLGVVPKAAADCDEAVELIQSQSFDVIVVDWREIENLGEFLSTVRRSKSNSNVVLVAIVRDLLDLRQAFTAGVHFLIHKPASAVQIERCLRAAYSATVARRRKQHRERVQILASVSTRTTSFAEAMVVNLSEGGVGLKTCEQEFITGVSLSSGEEVELRFGLPGTEETLHATGVVVWTTATHCGVRFTDVAESGRMELEQWLTECVQRSLAEFCEKMREQCA